MNYVLKDLLRIREVREKMAMDNLVKAKNALELAIKKVQQKEKELEDYSIWRKKEEIRLYDRIINKKVKREAVTELKFEIASMREKELKHEKAVKDAEEEREQAREAVEVAHELYKQATFNLQKIEEHKKAWVEEWKKEQERIMDKEMEEFQGKKMSRV